MDFLIGQIILFAGNFAPRGWAFCDGQLLSIQQHTAVFSILGNNFGGDGVRNFALPNLPVVVDTDGKGESRYIICLEGIYPSRW
ncbi:phage tail protein [Nostoc sp. CENA543]|uniref:phage tail protein n=1 Tax=Nostoc sp. CENA543 TaxID=1869241 RepID=UPI000CA3B83D|nr:tail fiber protein [Nostoc sp. CENA543]AUT01883.1 phage tail protein [Nostoc sp. CENA543]